MSGGSGQGAWAGALDAEFRRAAVRGLDVKLTIDPKVQTAAAQALGARKGAVVVLDPRNGEVLAMVSVPTYDPGALASKGEALLSDPTSPLLNRATQGRYPPGSTFKVVTAASALEHGVIRPETVVECPGEIVIEGFPISCRNVPQGVGTYPFSDAFTYSVNAIRPGRRDSAGRACERRGGSGSTRHCRSRSNAASRVLPCGSGKPLLASTAFGQGAVGDMLRWQSWPR